MQGANIYHINRPGDEALIQELKAGSSKAFMELYNRYHSPVYTFVLRIVKVPSVAEDILQEVFLKIWAIRERLRPELSFQAYLYRISRNLSWKMLKKMSADREQRLMLLNELNQSVSDADNRARWMEYEKLLSSAIDQLPPQRQKIFRLCRQEGKSYKDVSYELNISTNTVKEHMVLATRSIREYLSHYIEIIFFFTPTLFLISGI